MPETQPRSLIHDLTQNCADYEPPEMCRYCVNALIEAATKLETIAQKIYFLITYELPYIEGERGAAFTKVANDINDLLGVE